MGFIPIFYIPNFINMYILLFLLFFAACIRLLIHFVRKFQKEGFDWFSGSLYVIIYFIFCALFYLAIFTPYYLIVD